MTFAMLNSVIPNVLPRKATVCVTGKFPYGSRVEVEELIRKAGGIVHDEVMVTTDLLVSAQRNAGKSTTKLKKSVKYNTPVIDEQTFLRVLRGEISFYEATDKFTLNATAEVIRPSRIAPAKPRMASANAEIEALTKYVVKSMCDIGF